MTVKKPKYELAYEYEDVITYTCPVRGEVRETIKVKRYGSQPSTSTQTCR